MRTTGELSKISKMAVSMSKYESWLAERLLNLNPETDTDVFVSYITGILEEDVPNEEKTESLTDIIGQVVEDNIGDVCQELLKKWDDMAEQNGATGESQDTEKLTEHLSSILEQQKIEVVKPKEKSAEELARKQAILDHYQQVSSGDEDDDGPDDPGGQGDDLLEFKNTNADLVKKIEQEKKEKNKLEAEKKKEKDKQEREAQKQKQKDRKEQEKKRTQKGERKR